MSMIKNPVQKTICRNNRGGSVFFMPPRNGERQVISGNTFTNIALKKENANGNSN